jgi:(1->4)-alpha-D-glucan 1-alpha-D-glucosylmutase
MDASKLTMPPNGTIQTEQESPAPSAPESPGLAECLEQGLHQEVRVPRATYRLQVNKNFPFKDVADLAEYLQSLGIEDVYTSPIFEARPGSLHGYDVTNQNQLNTEAGGEPAFSLLASELKRRSMGLLLDIVPNHMGVGNDTPWWQDVLENGRSSRYANYFDIDWEPLKPAMRGKLLLPILGASYGEELESGHIYLCFENCTFHICYFEHRLPISPPAVPLIFSAGPDMPAPDRLELPPEIPQDFRTLLEELAHVPPHDTTDDMLASLRREQLAILKPRLQKWLCDVSIRAYVQQALERMKGTPGNAASFNRLHQLLEVQPYRLAHWRVSGDEINYRRFFDVNDLAGLRMENPEVFATTHQLIRRLLAEGSVTGLRIDHCDGLLDPRQYLIRLQKLALAANCCGPIPEPPIALNGIEQSVRTLLRGVPWDPSKTAVYTLVEKILAPRESLPPSWPVHGTTGYDFIYQTIHLFLQQKSERKLTQIYERFAPEIPDPEDVVYEKKLLVMNTTLSNEVATLTNLLSHLAAADRRARDFTTKVLAAIIRETIACMPVYRTYIDDRGKYTDQDKACIRYAISVAKRRNPNISGTAFNFLRETLLLNNKTVDPDDSSARPELYFALKFQQLSGPVMAKGVEDTAFYVYNRFIAANEVGGSLRTFGLGLEDFHKESLGRAKSSAHAMLASTTHDTKRSEDVRTRLSVLSEMPREWALAVRQWQRINRRHAIVLEDGRRVPSGNEEYFFYQTVAGTWPIGLAAGKKHDEYVERIQKYMIKSGNEAKVNMSWINPDPAYAEALEKFVQQTLSRESLERGFPAALEQFLGPVAFFGAINSLAQTLLKLASPGVPDFYQGTELWDFSLVDPDNRRPVDYSLRKSCLRQLKRDSEEGRSLSDLCRQLLDHWQDGRIKLWTIYRALKLRAQMPALFRDGSYQPLYAVGPLREHVVAFLREHEGSVALAVAPRFAYSLMGAKTAAPLGSIWGSARLILPPSARRPLSNVFTGESVTPDAEGSILLRDLLCQFPIALLSSP